MKHEIKNVLCITHIFWKQKPRLLFYWQPKTVHIFLKFFLSSKWAHGEGVTICSSSYISQMQFTMGLCFLCLCFIIWLMFEFYKWKSRKWWVERRGGGWRTPTLTTCRQMNIYSVITIKIHMLAGMFSS